MATRCPTWRPLLWRSVGLSVTLSGGSRLCKTQNFPRITSKIHTKTTYLPTISLSFVKRMKNPDISLRAFLRIRISSITVIILPSLRTSHLTPGELQFLLICRVGRDTINNSQDMKMKSEMPKSLAVIEKASESLAAASSTMKSDPYSKVKNISVEKSLKNLIQNI